MPHAVTVLGRHRQRCIGFIAEQSLRPGRTAPCSRLALMLLLLSFAGFGDASEPQHVLGSGVQLRCQRAAETRLECDYRLLRSAALEQVSARMNDHALPDPGWTPYEQPEGVSAILVMVDTSEPGRRPAMEKMNRHISALLDAAKPHHRIGLAAFDSDLALLAAIGSNPDAIRASAAKLAATGTTTELYRNALQAIRALASTPAHRRALLIMSDGLAEDRAYFHYDVVAAARAAGVTVFSIGYPSSVPLSVWLQSLRRLAEETGGLYTDTGQEFELGQDFIPDALASLDRGGRLTMDLKAAAELGLSGEQTLELDFALSDGRASATLQVELPQGAAAESVVKVVESRVPRLVEATTAVDLPARTASGASAAKVEEKSSTAAALTGPALPSPETVWGWYVLLPGSLLLALAFFLLLALRKRHLTGTGPSKIARSLAFLESQDGSNRRHAVTSAAYRIGRHSDNDLPILDTSVSRQHAEIHRRRNGSFTITDLDSMNGVFINQKKIDSVTLADGDIIEIGDMSFRFRMRQDAETTGEVTVALRTV